MDTLSTILQLLRVEGSIFCRAELAAPWGVATRGASSAIFHVIVRGSGQVEVDGVRDAQPFRAGELILLPHGHAHVLRSDRHVTPRAIRDLPTTPGPDGLPCVRHGGTGAETSILCGTFRFAPDGRDVLLPHLPPLLHAGTGGGPTAAWLDGTLRLLAAEVTEGRPGASLMVARLADVLFVQVLRCWLEEAAPVPPGWLGALADVQLSRALGEMHREPARDWTAELLARRAGMSRSAFFERFTAAVGETPAAYLARWRMTLARSALREGDDAVAEVAAKVGYASEAAFSRAFKREVGMSPSVWRTSVGEAATADPR